MDKENESALVVLITNSFANFNTQFLEFKKELSKKMIGLEGKIIHIQLQLASQDLEGMKETLKALAPWLNTEYFKKLDKHLEEDKNQDLEDVKGILKSVGPWMNADYFKKMDKQMEQSQNFLVESGAGPKFLKNISNWLGVILGTIAMFLHLKLGK